VGASRVRCRVDYEGADRASRCHCEPPQAAKQSARPAVIASRRRRRSNPRVPLSLRAAAGGEAIRASRCHCEPPQAAKQSPRPASQRVPGRTIRTHVVLPSPPAPLPHAGAGGVAPHAGAGEWRHTRERGEQSALKRGRVLPLSLRDRRSRSKQSARPAVIARPAQPVEAILSSRTRFDAQQRHSSTLKAPPYTGVEML
jgi:hypothetical protein